MNLDGDDCCTCDVGMGEPCTVCARYNANDVLRRDVLDWGKELKLKAKREKERAYNESLSLPNLMRHYQKLAEN